MHPESTIPLGVCQCGCGQRTGLARDNNPRLGYVRGQPQRFAPGHSIRRRRDPAERFWSRVLKTPYCWLWQGARFKDTGYGQFSGSPGSSLAHRFAWELTYGPIPDGLAIRHIVCCNRICVRLDHLVLGTAQDNSDDREHDGHTARGDRGGSRLHAPLLTWPQVREIRARYAAGDVSQAALCREYGVGAPHMSMLLRGLRWQESA
jgi:hypothetical protein